MRSRYERLMAEVREPDSPFILVVGILVAATTLYGFIGYRQPETRMMQISEERLTPESHAAIPASTQEVAPTF